MAKVKVETVGAYVDGNAPGSTIEIDERSAKYFESIGYVRIKESAKAPAKQSELPADEKGTSAPKKSAEKSEGKPKQAKSKPKQK